jgi:hypothetical protein
MRQKCKQIYEMIKDRQTIKSHKQVKFIVKYLLNMTYGFVHLPGRSKQKLWKIIRLDCLLERKSSGITQRICMKIGIRVSKFVDTFQFCLISVNNNGHFTWSHI